MKDAQAAREAARASQKITGKGIVDAADMFAHLDETVDGKLNAALEEDDIVGSGLSAGLDAFKIDSGPDAHPEKKMKALHKAFEERMMPQMKEDFPGMKLSQYKDKIFEMWKKDPSNPMNAKA